MGFHVIAGGLAARPVKAPTADDVLRERQRRLAAAGYERFRIRHMLTGEPIPSTLTDLSMRMGWVAEVLSSLNPIPSDFADDKYWPRD